MAHKSRNAIEAGRALCDRWARDFDLRTRGSRNLTLIRAQLDHDRLGPPGPRQAMAELELETCVTVLVHYGDKGKVGPLKNAAVHEILGRNLPHRDYWRSLERGALLMAGFELASPLGVPARDLAAAAEGETVLLTHEQIEQLDHRPAAADA